MKIKKTLCDVCEKKMPLNATDTLPTSLVEQTIKLVILQLHTAVAVILLQGWSGAEGLFPSQQPLSCLY